MEKILKIQSEQGFSETAIPPAFTNKLVDFIIPGNGTYDLSNSYINLNMEVVSTQAGVGAVTPNGVVPSDTALYNNDIAIYGDSLFAQKFRSPCVQVVRNADMFSANRGMVESIRRVNTLRQTLHAIENDMAEQHDGLDTFGSVMGRRGVGTVALPQGTSSLIQVIGSNTNLAGTRDTTQKSKLLARDFRIPLSDLFGVGNAQWNGDVYGDTRIHLELQPNKLQVQQLGGSEDVSTLGGAYGGATFGALLDYNAASLGQLPAANGLGTGYPLVTTLAYKDFQLNCPFYVGQAISYTGTSSVGGAIAAIVVIIDAIEYNLGTNNAAQPTGTGNVRIWTRTAVHTAAGAPEDITLGLIKAHTSDPATDQIRINRAEIVLSELVGVNGPSSIDYTTYSTEETVGNGAQVFNKQVICEPNAQNLIVATCNTGNVSPVDTWDNYRIAINNVDQTGNRDINWGKPIHKDRIMRFEQNRGQYPSNTSLTILECNALQATGGNQHRIYPILETLPLTKSQKLVDLRLDAGAGQTVEDVIFFKELVRTI